MEFTQDCIFNETMETQNYNTYISARWSTKERTLYLGMDNSGKPRTITITGEDRKLGKMFDYARVLTQVASPDRVVETLHRRMLAGAKHNVRHQHHSHDHHRQIGSDVAQHAICPSSSIQKSVGDGRDSFRCRKRKKRKKRKRRCRPDEQPGPQCRLAEGSVTDSTIDRYVTDMSSEIISTTPESKRSCEGAASEEVCRRQALSVPAKKRKSRIHSKFEDEKEDESVADEQGEHGDGIAVPEAARSWHDVVVPSFFVANGARQRGALGLDSHVFLLAVSSCLPPR